MIEYTLATGNTGTLIIDDNTDGPDKTVDLYIISSSTIAVPQLPWTYSIDGVIHDWQQFNFQDQVTRQHLGLVYVGAYSSQFTLHLGSTGTTQLGGPTDMVIDINGGVKYVNIKVGDVYKKALPFVNVEGVWHPASAYVMDQSWKPVS